LVDLQRVDFPERIGEGSGVVLDIVLTGRCFRRAGRISAPHLARPVAAESNVKDYLLVLERLCDVATASKFCHWVAPSARVWGAAVDVAWDARARKMPNGDGLASPFRRIDTAVGIIEAGTVARSVSGAD
jgi:hypothetical protein